jgi:hypothetical protein
MLQEAIKAPARERAMIDFFIMYLFGFGYKYKICKQKLNYH